MTVFEHHGSELDKVRRLRFILGGPQKMTVKAQDNHNKDVMHLLNAPVFHFSHENQAGKSG